MILLNQITSAVLQLLIFSSVPFVWYILTHKRVKGFFKWLGFKTAPNPPLKAMFCILAGFLVGVFLPYMWLYKSGNLNYQGFTVDAFRQTGWSIETFTVILIWAVVQTSLSEEILFRGFLCKRLCNKWGETVGNALQALIFGMIHIVARQEPPRHVPHRIPDERNRLCLRMAFVKKSPWKHFIWLGDPCCGQYSFAHSCFYIFVAQLYAAIR